MEPSRFNISSLPSITHLLLYTTILSFLIWNIKSYLRLRHIPGPFLASLTNLPRLSWVYSNHAGHIHTALHRRDGPIVRFGPNMVSVADPAEISTIYDIHGKFLKSDFYWVLSFYLKGKAIPGLFATQDRRIHGLLRKPIAGIYSMTSMVSYEPMVDSTIECFFRQLETRFVETGQVCPLDSWLQMFAFDVIGSITFSKRLGFLEQGRDIDNIIENSWNYFRVAAVKTQMPWLDLLWTKNPLLQRLRTARTNPIVAFAAARRKERTMETAELGARDTETDEKTAEKKKNKENKDFLTRFLEVESRDPATPSWAVSAWSTSNITAGSDTTAILLRTIIYNLLKHPTSMQKLRDEIMNSNNSGTTTSPPDNDVGDQKHHKGNVTWKQAQNFPYLHACIKEAGRLHPPFGLPYERVVPAPGATICGTFLPAGTVIGMSPWATHRDPALFGPDAEEWRPERWLAEEQQKGDEARIRKMENALLTFGAGNRSCIGKHISYLEIVKVVPSLLRAFD
ncbi:MAG: hypothetical protein Q9169_007657, partial [Polycauliona sp. 2 TL-2023]